jgi:hypothetical protein
VTGRRVSAAAGLLLGATVILLVYAFRHQILHFLLAAAGIGVMWATLRRQAARRRRRKGLVELGLAAAAGAVVARRAPASHPCVQCGKPIGAPSRRAYCDPGCREFARLERLKKQQDARALSAYSDEIPWN